MKNKQYYIDKIKLRYPDIKLICNDPETILKKRLIYLDRVCDIHGVVSTPVESLLEGRNCKYCTGGSMTHLPLFIDQLNSKFNSTIECLSSEYTNNATKLDFKCLVCDYHFSLTPNTLLTKSNGCIKCFKKDYISPYRLTTEEFTTRAKSIHVTENNEPKYEYDCTNYTRADEFVDIRCKVHGVFRQVARDHTNSGKGCPSCTSNVSKAEIYILKTLNERMTSIQTSYRPRWLNNKELDIYIPSLNLAIEYNGLTYHHSTKGISTFCDATYKEPNYHLNKYNLCKENGIDLIHIFEFEDLDAWLVKLGSYDPACNNIVFNNIERNYGKYTYYGISEII